MQRRSFTVKTIAVTGRRTRTFHEGKIVGNHNVLVIFLRSARQSVISARQFFYARFAGAFGCAGTFGTIVLRSDFYVLRSVVIACFLLCVFVWLFIGLRVFFIWYAFDSCGGVSSGVWCAIGVWRVRFLEFSLRRSLCWK